MRGHLAAHPCRSITWNAASAACRRAARIATAPPRAESFRSHTFARAPGRVDHVADARGSRSVTTANDYVSRLFLHASRTICGIDSYRANSQHMRRTTMQYIVSALLALSVLTSVAASASALDAKTFYEQQERSRF
jgi:hypothetical protein